MDASFTDFGDGVNFNSYWPENRIKIIILNIAGWFQRIVIVTGRPLEGVVQLN